MSQGHDPLDPHLRLLRVIATGVLIAIIALYIGAGIITLPFVRIDFQPDGVTLGSLFGSLFVLLGLLAPRWPGRKE